MRLKNTSRYPLAEVRRLVDFATHGVNMNNVAVHVKNCSRAYAGRAYCGVPCMSSAYSTSAHYLVTLRIGSAAAFPADNMVERVRWTGPWMTRAELAAAGGCDPKVRVRIRSPKTEEERARLRAAPLLPNGQPETALFQVAEVWLYPYGGKRAPFIVVNDWREALVAVASHEARHCHQFRHNKRRSEVDAERFAARALDRYRASLKGGA